jgi:DNA-binding NtrC family response regulator
MPAAQLRASVWQSIFIHDAPRYQRVLFERMSGIPTLITGPSGTGKELVARAIGLSRYVAFDEEKGASAESFLAGFHAVNLLGLSPTRIESELFGHTRGPSGAVQDRAGWLETCGPGGTVFLDEIGELDPTIQVMLRRMFQTRSFQRIGETEERVFVGKIIAATNRDLAAEVRSGGFRPDFYYRLCADMIQPPTLRDQIGSSPGEISSLLDILASRIGGNEEGPSLAAEVETFVNGHLGADDSWPGNVRELEQCVRNILVRGP